jgi:hyperosmotically inducible protein
MGISKRFEGWSGVWATAALLLGLSLPALGATLASGQTKPEGSQARLARLVRHELVMLPYYTVFDNLQYQITDGNTVVLKGQVTRPTLKSDAENVVKRVEGVSKVVNEIEVLPLSPMDDGIRIRTYWAIYGSTGLDRYGLQAVPPIHIIVKNGNVTLVGIVANQADKDLAGIRAKSVSGVFSVTNDLTVENRK